MRQKHILLHMLICCMVCTPLLQSTAFAQNITLTLNPAVKNGSLAWWTTWHPRYETNVAFEAKLTGDTAALTSTSYSFTLVDVSDWPGHCMNMGTQTASDKDLEFRKADQPTVDGATYDVLNRGQTLTVTFASETDASETDEATLREVRFEGRVLDYTAVGKLQATVNKSTQGAPAPRWIPRAPPAAAHLARGFHDVTSNDR